LNLLHLNLLLLTVGCVLLSAGFAVAGRERRWATAAMVAGILCILFMIDYDIHRLVAR
jgi:hypothetical protein